MGIRNIVESFIGICGLGLDKMKGRMGILGVIGAMTLATTGRVFADSWSTYGNVSLQNGNFQMTSDFTPPVDPNGTLFYAGLADQITSVLTPATLTQLSADYEMTQGTFGGGAPRIDLWDAANLNNEAWIYLGKPIGGGSFVDPNLGGNTLVSTGNYADLNSADVRVYVNGFGGINSPNTGVTWAQFVAEAGTVQIGYVTLDLDGGWSQPGNKQVMLANNFDVNGSLDTAASPVPLPATGRTSLILLCGLGLIGGLRHLRRQVGLKRS